MSKKSSIEWTESTWNPITGCSKISPGCKNCYAERMAKRLKAMGQPNYRSGFKITTHPHATELPLKWKKPQTIFVNSMSDIFHESVQKAFILKLFDVMNKADWHLYQILTKRSERMLELNSEIPWSKHIWMGVTVENGDYKFRIDDLRKAKANVKFLSFEPLIGNIGKVNLKGIDWVIVGGESGPGARPMKEEWVLEIKRQCVKYNVPFFFKQWGGVRKKKNGRTLLNKTWDEMPELEDHPSTRNHFKRVVDLISGFETPFGMELLSTVHWVATHEGATTADQAVSKTYKWNNRKRMFQEKHIRLSWNILERKGWLQHLQTI